MIACSYSTIAWASTLKKGVQPDVDYSYKARTRTGAFFDFITALGDVAFAYAGHNVVLEIQATIPSSPENPSKKPMWRGAFLAYLVVAFCYFPVALIGYWCYGNSVDDNILISLQKPSWLIAAANMFVVIHVIGSYQVLFLFNIISNHQFFLIYIFVSMLQSADICNCSVRLAGNCIGEETPLFSFFQASLCYSHGICW